MDSPVITYRDILTDVKIEESFYEVLLTVGLHKNTDLYLEFNFQNLDMNKYKVLADLYKKKGSLSIESEFLNRKDYKISHIVPFELHTGSDLAVKWYCLSDDPDISLELD